ncbi:MAG: hypothetical protein ACRD9R_08025 [Pyrinomonadaceae bacterium]
MPLSKNLAGFSVSLVTLCAAIFLTRFLLFLVSPMPQLAPDTRTVITCGLSPAVEEEIGRAVQLITLDREAYRAYTKLTLTRDADGPPAPERVWVWTYFFTPDGRKTWAAEPVEVRDPFRDNSHRATVTVSSACHWCDDVDTPAHGYYAGVRVSTVSKYAAALPNGSLDFDITRAAQVVVEGGRRK